MPGSIYPGNGREFLREFYKRIDKDQDFRALTATEAIAAAGKDVPSANGIFPASWIKRKLRRVDWPTTEDVAAWELLWGRPPGLRARR